ncbi:response regulator [Olivibacter sp. XZL3]|uniref:response regulator transcription factor n=1 Tax=Olivibacter sp. XZL3 TaxID=1735116 RepID=UPI0010666F87|nr:response regulator transcription factor [Olivibacter sp. XZL3]
MECNIGILDDQRLFLHAISLLIQQFEDFNVVIAVENSFDLYSKLKSSPSLPDILLIDVVQPTIDVASLVKEVKNSYPDIKLVALSAHEDSDKVIKMVKAGCCAYLSKMMAANELKEALESINSLGYYNNHLTSLSYHHMSTAEIVLTDREREFLNLAASDFNYQEIAGKMFLSVKTIDGYRASLFEKFNVKSRVGLILEAIRRNYLEV